jgi:hypothetical protein
LPALHQYISLVEIVSAACELLFSPHAPVQAPTQTRQWSLQNRVETTPVFALQQNLGNLFKIAQDCPGFQRLRVS